MTHGTKRWGLGYGCGAATVLALCFYEKNASQGFGLMAGMAIMLFFADYLLARRDPEQTGDGK